LAPDIVPDVMLDNRERFFNIPHVSFKRGNLGRFKRGDAKSLQYLAECGWIVDCVPLATGSAVSINLNRSMALYLTREI